jgi:large subunit ribosomal protein L7/L12
METTEIKQLADQFASLTVKEVGELASILRDKHSLELAISTVQYRSPGEGDYSPDPDRFDVVLKSGGVFRIDVIRGVKKIFNIGLKEAKELVDIAPVFIACNKLESEAKFIKKELEALGADVEIKEL